MSRVARLFFVIGGIVLLLVAAATGFIVRGVWERRANTGEWWDRDDLKSTALVRVSARPPAIYSGVDNRFDPAEWGNTKHTVMAMVKSGLVISRALDEKSVQELAIVKEHVLQLEDWLADQISVEFPDNGELMVISLAVGDHDQSRTILGAIVDAFQREVIDRERTARIDHCDNLEKKLKALQSQVLEKERQLCTAQTAKVPYKMQVDALDTLMRERSDVQRQMTDLEFKLSLIKVKKELAEKNGVPEEEIEAAIAKDPQIQQMASDLAKLKREQKKKDASDEKAGQAQAEIAELTQSIDEAKSNARLQIINELLRTAEASSAEMVEGLAEHQLLEAQYRKITDDIGTKAKEVQEFEKFNGDEEQLRADIDQLKGIVREMGTALIKQKIELDAEPRVSIVQQAN